MLKMRLRTWILLISFVIFSSGCLTTDVIQGMDTGELQYINATSIDMVGFASYSGCTITNISDINNYNCSAVEDASVTWMIRVNFTNITNFSKIEIKNKYYNTVGASTHINYVKIFCNVQNDYVILDSFTNSNDWWYYSKDIPDDDHFIDSNGNVSILLIHPTSGTAGHENVLDTMRLIVQPTFEQNIITQTQYFNTTTGGSGASNLSQLTIDTNKSWLGYNIFNVTIDNQSMSSKINKSGDTMTGNLNFSSANITNATNVKGVHLIGSYTSDGEIPLVPDNPTCFSGSCSKYTGQFSTENASNQFIFWDLSNNSNSLNGFTAIRTNGTLYKWDALGSGQIMFFIGAKGSNGNETDASSRGDTQGSKVSIYFATDGVWNGTSNPTAIYIGTTAVGSTTRTNRLKIWANGSIQILSMSGLGRTYLCQEAGFIVAGTPGC